MEGGGGRVADTDRDRGTERNSGLDTGGRVLFPQDVWAGSKEDLDEGTLVRP